MKLNRIIAATLAALLCWCAPALAGIALIPGSSQQYVAFGNNNVSTTTVVSGASTAAVPIGSLVYLAISARALTASYSSCTDSVGNTYSTPVNNYSPTTGVNSYAFGITTILAPIGTTWTCTLTGTQTNKGILVAAASGAAASSPHDAASATPTNGSGTAIAVGPTGTLSCPGGGANCEILFASFAMQTQGTLSGTTAGYTLIGCDSGSTSNHCLLYQIVSAATASSFAINNSAGVGWAANLEAFTASVAAGTLQGGTLLRGAGR